MSLATIRDGLATRLTTANTSLRFFDTVPDNPSPPCAWAGLATGRYKDDFDGDWSFTLPVYVIVSRAGGNPRAIDQVDAYVETSGSASIYAAVQGDPTLGHACHDANVTDFTEGLAPPYDFLNADYVGVTFNIEVMA